MRISNFRYQISKIFFCLLFSLFTFHFSLFTITYAHVLKTDGNIGAVLHIDPDDDPIAKEQSTLVFEFKDKQGKFIPKNCDCTFSVTEDGKEISSQPLFQNNADQSSTNASVFYTFSEKNIYQIKIAGKPNSPDAFQAFSLIFDVRVAKISQNSPSITQNASTQNLFSTHIPQLIGIIIIAGFSIVVLIKYLIKPKV
jgi:hypothetical protein